MTNEEQGERYELIVSGAGLVEIFDNEQDKSIAGFAGPDRLLAATTELTRLNAVEGMWTSIEKVTQPVTPATFLAETLPALARRQQLESQLAQVEAIKEHARSEVQRWQEIAQSAFDLRNRIREAIARPLSATETAQNAPGVGEDTIAPFGFVERLQAAQRALNKPGPY